MNPAILLAGLALATPAATGAPPGPTVGQTAAPAAPRDDPSNAAGAGDVPLGFEEALQRALVANASVGQARAEVELAAAQKRGALSAVLPRLQATGGLIRNSEEAAFGAPPNQRVILPLNDWNLRLWRWWCWGSSRFSGWGSTSIRRSISRWSRSSRP